MLKTTTNAKTLSSAWKTSVQVNGKWFWAYVSEAPRSLNHYNGEKFYNDGNTELLGVPIRN